MKVRSRQRGGSWIDPGLSPDEDMEWPAAVRRLAMKLQAGPRLDSRKAKSLARGEEETKPRLLSGAKGSGDRR